MKNSEEAIERALAGLRDADAPIGMELRILSALEDRAAVEPRWGCRWLRPIWLVAPVRPNVTRSLVCGVALAGVFGVALMIPAIRRLGHAPAQSKVNAPSAGSRSLAPSAAVARSSALAWARPALRSVKKTDVNGEGTVSESDCGSVGDSDAVALSEMLAPSHPAPPLPLTEQERLLLRIAHKGDPVEMAMLDPLLRAARDEEEKTDFQRFFGAATIGKPATEQSTTVQPALEQPTTEQPATEQPATERPATERPIKEQSTTGDNK
jgi:hypothetical protein